MSDVTQEQVDKLVSKPRSQWTAADRVLLAKARKEGLKVELPDEAPPQVTPRASAPAEGLPPEEEMAALMEKPKAQWSPEEKARFAELAKMGVKVKKPQAPSREDASKAGAPPDDDPQAQARYLEQKPKSQWTAADRVLLSKLRKQDVAVNLPEEAPAVAKAPPKPPKEAPAKKEEAVSKEMRKPAEPDVMGPYLQTLYRMRVGTEEVKPHKVAEIARKADDLKREVVEAMGKEEFTLDELAKKDITLRQRYERAMLIYEALEKLGKAGSAKGS